MRQLFIAITISVLTIFPAISPVAAQDKSLGVLGSGFYAFATSESQKNGAVFGTFKNTKDSDVEITTVSGDVAEMIELHTMSMDKDVMQMREVESYVVPAGRALSLEPSGKHIMLMGLKAPLKVGDTFYIRVADADNKGILLPVSVRGAGDVAPVEKKAAPAKKAEAVEDAKVEVETKSDTEAPVAIEEIAEEKADDVMKPAIEKPQAVQNNTAAGPVAAPAEAVTPEPQAPAPAKKKNFWDILKQ